MTRQGNTLKDKGHYVRKAGWLAGACLLFIPHVLFTFSRRADEWIMDTGARLHRWSHPCLYADTSEIPKR